MSTSDKKEKVHEKEGHHEHHHHHHEKEGHGHHEHHHHHHKDKHPDHPDRAHEVAEFVKQTVKTFHISSAYDCLETTQTNLNFTGICLLHLLGSETVLEDNEHKVQSGYIFNTRVINIEEVKKKKAVHQAYARVFEKIKKSNGVLIIGFEQHEKHLKVIKKPFENKKIRKNFPKHLLKYSDSIFHILTFGAILTYKLSGQQNVTPQAAAAAYCLYNLIHQHGSSAHKSRFPVVKMKVPNHKRRFLRHVFENLGLPAEVLDLAFCHDLNDEKWFSNGIKTILDGLKGQVEHDVMSLDDYNKMVEEVAKVFNSDGGGASDFLLSQDEIEE